MSYEFSNLSLPLQKVIDLGEIDRWLRGVAEIVPQPSAAVLSEAVGTATDLPMGVIEHDFNTHTLYFGNSHLITTNDIERMVGFRQLLTAASRQNVRVDVDDMGGGQMEVSFTPGEAFSKSRVFGASYSNVLPALFGHPKLS
jgi:hypothetical protein